MTRIPGPAVPADLLFRDLAPRLAGGIARILADRHGLWRSHDLLTAGAETLRLVAGEAGLPAGDVLRGAGLPALHALRPRRSAADWDALARQGPEAPAAPDAVQARASAAFAALFDTAAGGGRMSPRSRAALAAWVLAALLLAHCGPRDADLGLAELADRL